MSPPTLPLTVVFSWAILEQSFPPSPSSFLPLAGRLRVRIHKILHDFWSRCFCFRIRRIDFFFYVYLSIVAAAGGAKKPNFSATGMRRKERFLHFELQPEAARKSQTFTFSQKKIFLPLECELHVWIFIAFLLMNFLKIAALCTMDPAPSPKVAGGFGAVFPVLNNERSVSASAPASVVTLLLLLS